MKYLLNKRATSIIAKGKEEFVLWLALCFINYILSLYISYYIPPRPGKKRKPVDMSSLIRIFKNSVQVREEIKILQRMCENFA